MKRAPAEKCVDCNREYAACICADVITNTEPASASDYIEANRLLMAMRWREWVLSKVVQS